MAVAVQNFVVDRVRQGVAGRKCGGRNLGVDSVVELAAESVAALEVGHSVAELEEA